MNIGSQLEFVSSNVAVLRNTDQALIAFNYLDEWAPSTAWAIDQRSFDELLGWLDSTPEAAGRKYEQVRRGLIRMFRHNGCGVADVLADVTFDRVARKLPEIRPSYVGNPMRYFYGVARNVLREYLQSISRRNIVPMTSPKEDQEELLQRLDFALDRLEREDRELILEYYRTDVTSAISHRKWLAKQVGLCPAALRVRACRIRSRLRSYLDNGKPGLSGC